MKTNKLIIFVLTFMLLLAGCGASINSKYMNVTENFMTTMDENVLERIAHGFMNNLKMIGDITIEIFIWMFSNLPILLLCGIGIIIIINIIKISIRKIKIYIHKI